MKSYDFIILGAGSAGCVLANRLSANPNFNVCLIEAGSKDSDMRLHVPLGFAFLGEGSKYSWNYNTEPQKEFEKVILTEQLPQRLLIQPEDCMKLNHKQKSIEEGISQEERL